MRHQCRIQRNRGQSCMHACMRGYGHCVPCMLVLVMHTVHMIMLPVNCMGGDTDWEYYLQELTMITRPAADADPKKAAGVAHISSAQCEREGGTWHEAR